MLVIIALNKTLNVDENFTFEDFSFLTRQIYLFLVLSSSLHILLSKCLKGCAVCIIAEIVVYLLAVREICVQ